MKSQLSNKEISNLISSFEQLNDENLESLSNRLAIRQPYLTSMVEAAYEIFEEEEDYIEELDYNMLLIDYIFTKTIGEIETIMPEFLEKKDDEHLKIIDDIADDEDFDDKLYSVFEAHPRADLILYFYDDLFDEEIEFDDESLELTTQLMLMIFLLIDIYHNSIQSANEA